MSEKHESSRVDIRLGGVINNVERGVLGLRVASVVTGVEVRIGNINCESRKSMAILNHQLKCVDCDCNRHQSHHS